MLKNLKKILSLILSLFIILMLFSCSVNDSNNIFKNYDLDSEEALRYETTQAYAVNNAMSRSMKFAAVDSVAPAAVFESASGNVSANNNSTRKVIKNYNISAETNNFETAYNELNKKIEELKGMVDNSSIYNNYYRENKSAKHLDMTVRIEADKAAKFVDYLSTILNVTSRSENIEDVTDDYNDINIRIATLETEISRLQELIKKAEKVTEIVEIEQKISSSTSELQKLKNRINNYDKRINYSTIYINIDEVVVLTEVKDNIPSNDKIKQAFDKNLSDTKKFIINIGIYIFTHIPAIFMVLCIILLICIFFMVKNKIREIKQNKKNITVENEKNDDVSDNKTDQEIKTNIINNDNDDKNDKDLDSDMDKTDNDKQNKENFDEAYEKLKNNISDDTTFRA